MEPPIAQPPPDQPRSRPLTAAPTTRTQNNATNAPDKSVSFHTRIEISWSETAQQSLKKYAREKARQREARPVIGGKAIFNASNGAKRAHNLVARQAITRALQHAQPLYPALISHLAALKVPAQWSVDLQWLGDNEMQTINADTRGKNKPTDVLSFPVWEGELFPLAPDESALMLGDLLISVETAMVQAQELNHDLRAEIAFLAVHGTLHLLGYDHTSPAPRRKMFALQDQIVAQLREEKGF